MGRATRLLDHGVHRIGRDSALADPVINAVELEIDGVALGLGRVGAEVFDGVAIATRTGFSDNHAIERLMHGANLGETNFESHDGCFAERFLLRKTEDNTGAGYVIMLPSATIMNPKIVAGGRGQPVMSEFQLEANPDTTLDCMVQICRYPA